MSLRVKKAFLVLNAFLLGCSGVAVQKGGLAVADRYAGGEGESVVVVANSRDRDSVAIAEHYLARRGIPGKNLILIDAPEEEVVHWTTFVDRIYNPLLLALVNEGWIDAVPSRLKDIEGRIRVAIAGHSIKYLVLCRGIPLKIYHDGGRLRKEGQKRLAEQFKTNRASVDAELSLIARSESPINGWVPNPLFNKPHVSEVQRNAVVRVARLDGPSFADALNLVDRALAAEGSGLIGRAYVDLGGVHPSGDRWLQDAAESVRQLGIDLELHEARGTFGKTARFDAPALYFGWYANDINGPFLNPGFRFPPGAVAIHIHSFSAATMRSADKRWCGGFVARGAAATVGNVWEPYLQHTHRPDLLLSKLAAGAELGEAAYYSLNALSWQAVLVGDPLYRPFKVSLEAQIERLELVPPRLRQYAVIRKMRALQAEGRGREGLVLGEASIRANPGPALALVLADYYLEADRRRDAVRVLRTFERVEHFVSDDWVPVQEIAERLVGLKNPAAAVKIYGNLIESPDMPREIRKECLAAGSRTAKLAGEIRLALEWSTQRP